MNITPRLKLLNPVGTDPFLRTDFETNWNLIDAAPGIATGVSTARPAWDASQANRIFYDTDQRRLIAWTGSAWMDLLQNAQSFGDHISAPTIGTPAVGQVIPYNFPAISLARDSVLAGSTTAVVQVAQSGNAYFIFDMLMDGVSVSLQFGSIRYAGTGAAGTLMQWTINVPWRTGILAKGAHTPAIRVHTVIANSTQVNGAAYSAISGG